MATTSIKTICVACHKEKITYLCQGCLETFCLHHLSEHRKNLTDQLDLIENDRDRFRENLDDQKTNPTKHPSIKQIDQWEKDSIDKIKQTANQCREKLINFTKKSLLQTEKRLDHSTEQIKEMRRENEFNELDLNHLNQRLKKLQEAFLRLSNVSIEQQSTSFISKISLLRQWDTQWKQLGMTIAGGNGQGDRLDQLYDPFGICVDNNDQTIYIADWGNDRLVEWTSNATNGRIVASANETNQLNLPADVIIDRENNSLIIADRENRRVMQWSRRTSSHGQIIISDINCWGLAMDKGGSLYVSDSSKNEVRRWRKGETDGTVVAGGNGQGDQLNQLNCPTYLFVDDDQTLYVSDTDNHRVMKWVKDDKEGLVVAGGNGAGSGATQLCDPSGVIVDQFGQVYVADTGNDRVMRWCEEAEEGTIVVGGNGRGQQANQFHCPVGLSFDGEENLYVVDRENQRVQKFLID